MDQFYQCVGQIFFIQDDQWRQDLHTLMKGSKNKAQTIMNRLIQKLPTLTVTANGRMVPHFSETQTQQMKAYNLFTKTEYLEFQDAKKSKGSYSFVRKIKSQPQNIPLILRSHQTGESELEFLREVVLQAFLTCSLKNLSQVTDQEIPLPRLFGVFQNQEQVFTVIQPFDMTFDALIEKGTDKMIIDAFLQIVSGLYLLQDTLNFLHGDFWTRNIMVRRRSKVKMMTYAIGEEKVEWNSEFRVFFIDFGTTCVTPLMEVKERASGDDLYYVTGLFQQYTLPNTQWGEPQRCYNPTFDLGLLLASMYNLHHRRLRQIPLFQYLLRNEKPNWHNAYDYLHEKRMYYDPVNLWHRLYEFWYPDTSPRLETKTASYKPLLEVEVQVASPLSLPLSNKSTSESVPLSNRETPESTLEFEAWSSSDQSPDDFSSSPSLRDSYRQERSQYFDLMTL